MGIIKFLTIFLTMYPLVMTDKAMENGHGDSEFSQEKTVIFHTYVTAYQRVVLCHDPSNKSDEYHRSS